VTETDVTSAIDMLRDGDEVVTVAGLIRHLSALPPDLPVVMSLDGPDPGVCSPLEWVNVMGYWPESPYHGDPFTWDPDDGDDPGVVRAVVFGPRGLPDEARPPKEGE